MAIGARKAVSFEGFSSGHQCFIALIVGLVIGFSITQLLVFSRFTRPAWLSSLYSKKPQAKFNDRHYFKDKIENDDEVPQKRIHEHTHALEASRVAQKLYKEVRVLCWVMTGPKNHQKRAIHVKRTWGKRCNKLLFMSSVEDKELGAIALNVSEGRNWLWGKTKEAFKYIYENYFDDYDWFYKADDDTYTIMENMRYLLYPYSTETPIYFGAKFGVNVKPNGYMSGGAGYVLSKEAVRRFVTVGLPNPQLCAKSNGGPEDVLIGLCLQKLNVTAGDSRDFDTRGRFFPFAPGSHLLGHPKRGYWYWAYVFYKTDEGLDCCSDYTISFHYIEPSRMYYMDYLVYHLRQYGAVRWPEKLPKRLEKGEVMPTPTSPQTPTNV